MDIINTKIREELLNNVEANKISEARKLVVAKSVKIEKAKFTVVDAPITRNAPMQSPMTATRQINCFLVIARRLSQVITTIYATSML